MPSKNSELIILDEINSTNEYLKEISKKNTDIPEFTAVLAKKQTEGKGQRGNSWISEDGKNLSFSVFLCPEYFWAENQFEISKFTAVSIVETLQKINKNISIKWSNDIYFENKKIGGVLIENTILGNRILNSVIGIGLNVNNNNFTDLPFASSLKLISGKEFSIEETAEEIIQTMKKNYHLLYNPEELHKLYLQNLYLRNVKSKFETNNGTNSVIFEGIIKGIDKYGRLLVENNENKILNFDIKEIRFL